MHVHQRCMRGAAITQGLAACKDLDWGITNELVPINEKYLVASGSMILVVEESSSLR